MIKALPSGASLNRHATRQHKTNTFFSSKRLFLTGLVATAVLGVATLITSEPEKTKRVGVSSLAIDGHQTLDIKQALTQSGVIDGLVPSSPLKHLFNDLETTLGVWKSVTIKAGDNLSNLFQQQGLGAGVVHTIASTSGAGKELAHIRPGETLEFRVNKAGELTQLRYIQSKLKSIFFTKAENSYTAEHITLQPQVQLTYTEGRIENSLFLASQKAGLSNSLTMKLAEIFGWDIDFVQDIRSGDKFNLIYEENYLNDEKLSDGNILSATFTNQGKTYTALRYTDSKGNTGYYSKDGQSMKKAFLRTPVDFTRISSRFNPNRLHPVFKTKRPHRGVDYAASTNTPIKAAGDGRIKFSGWQNGYGNVVYIQHPNNIVTVYAHQNKIGKGIAKGKTVRQGQTIGYVGKTGWATGPHLHYEFRVNGQHRNPVTVKLPDASPISKQEMARFKRHTRMALQQLESSSNTVLAQK